MIYMLSINNEYMKKVKTFFSKSRKMLKLNIIPGSEVCVNYRLVKMW